MLHLRELREEDKDLFLQASSCEPGCEKIYEDELASKMMWKIAMGGEGEFTYYVIGDDVSEFIGYCGVKEGNSPEICISLLKQFQGKGFGKIALQLLWDRVSKERKIIRFIARVEEDNMYSIKMFEKLGAKKVKTEESKVLQNLREFAKEQKNMEDILKGMEAFHKKIIQYSIEL